MRALVVAPHPDDEILGAGGVMARLIAEGSELYVVIVTKGTEPMFSREGTIQCRKDARAAHELLGVRETEFLDLPAALLDTVPHSELNSAIEGAIARIRPDVLFVPFPGDIHLDHRLVFESVMVACRPNGQAVPRSIYAYETLSETNWNAPGLYSNFAPNVFVDVSDFLERKLEALRLYQDELRSFPNERSEEAVMALARHRGATVFCAAAEAFVLIRSIVQPGPPDALSTSL